MSSSFYHNFMKSLQSYVFESLTVKNKKSGEVYDVEKFNPKTQTKVSGAEDVKQDDVKSKDAKSDEKSKDKKSDEKSDDTKHAPKVLDVNDLFDDSKDVDPIFKKRITSNVEDYNSDNQRLSKQRKDEDQEVSDKRDEDDFNLQLKRKKEDKAREEARSQLRASKKKSLSSEDYKVWLKKQTNKEENEDKEIDNNRHLEDVDIQQDKDDEDNESNNNRRKEDNSVNTKLLNSIDELKKNLKDLPAKTFGDMKSLLTDFITSDHIEQR